MSCSAAPASAPAPVEPAPEAAPAPAPAPAPFEAAPEAALPPATGGAAGRKRPSHKGVDFRIMTKKQLRQRLLQRGGIMAELHAMAAEMRVRGHGALRKPELVARMVGKATAGNGFLARLKTMSA